MRKGPFILWVAVAFLVLAITFILDLWGGKREKVMHPVVKEKYFSSETVRNPRLEPITSSDGFLYRCNDCHGTLQPTEVHKSFYSAHKDIVLQHGANQSCKTCHSEANKDFLLDIHGNDIPFSKSEENCMACHGPMYRDWERGVHGKMGLYWDEAKRAGETKLTCVYCHNPHQPTFESMEPSPPPHTYNYQDEMERQMNEKDSH